MKETGDYSHFMYTVSSNILDKGHGVKNNWTNMGARETSWSNAEERKDIVGWLGDAVYDGSENQVSFGESDYIADVDADNIAYRYDNKTSDERLIDVMKDYYEDIDENPDKIRTQEFVENNSYDSIESSILDIVGDVNHDGKKDIGDLNNPTYKETKAFLNRLKRLR